MLAEKGVEFTRRDVFSIVDAAFAPVFRYFDVIDQFVDLQLFAKTPAVGLLISAESFLTTQSMSSPAPMIDNRKKSPSINSPPRKTSYDFTSSFRIRLVRCAISFWS